jgi:uncharacterized membrane protein
MTFELLHPFLIEWGSLLIRWLHVITAIAWIGSSFYFMHIDASLRAIPDIAKGGEAWEVHGGGFYHVRKYLVAPSALPEDLIWHKWQSYSTWISGFALLVWVYYAQSDLYLIDPSVRELSPGLAALIGIGALFAGWVFYDLLSRALKDQDGLLAAIGLMIIMLACFGFQQVFSGRGALLHTGALMATWMTANVFAVIIPNQKKVIASLIKGQTPDPALGKQAKQRSTHNNYITLPVLFLMLSNHYPMTSSTPYAWALVGCITVAGALIRVFYNLRHAGKGNQWWTWILAALLMAVAMVISLTSSPIGRSALGLSANAVPELKPSEKRAAAVPEAVAEIMASRCSMCHAREPVWPKIGIAPKGVYLETAEDIETHRHQILVQAVLSHAMPPNNLTYLEDAERQALFDWLSRHPVTQQ